MSIFDLPYSEYIKAQEKIMELEAVDEENSETVIAKLTGRSECRDKRIKMESYSVGISFIWWRNVWKTQYQSQGGVI